MKQAKIIDMFETYHSPPYWASSRTKERKYPKSTCELPGKQCPIPSSRYRLSFCITLCTRHCCCYATFLFYCITCLCYLSLSYAA